MLLNCIKDGSLQEILGANCGDAQYSSFRDAELEMPPTAGVAYELACVIWLIQDQVQGRKIRNKADVLERLCIFKRLPLLNLDLATYFGKVVRVHVAQSSGAGQIAISFERFTN